MGIHLPLDAGKVDAFCRRHGIRRMAVFGSALADDFRPDSDLDVLVEFRSSTRVGLIGLAALELELGRIVGRAVDMNTAACLNPRFRSEVLRHAEVVFEQA